MVSIPVSTAYIGLKGLQAREPLFERDDAVLKRYEMVREYFATGQSAEKVAGRYGYSGSALYYWLPRFREMGISGLEGEKTGPKSPIKVNDHIQERIFQIRREEDLSITEIASVLRNEGIDIASTTVNRVLSKNGFPKKKRGRKPNQTTKA